MLCDAAALETRPSLRIASHSYSLSMTILGLCFGDVPASRVHVEWIWGSGVEMALVSGSVLRD